MPSAVLSALSGRGELVFGSKDLALKSAQIVEFFCGKCGVDRG